MKVGDIVQLTCGGPSMTVADVFENDRVSCVYFDNSWQNVLSESFPVKALKKVKKSSKNKLEDIVAKIEGEIE